MRLCRERGIKVGLRFTMTERNAHHLPAMLDLVEAEAIDKFYLSHLVYAGRGNRYRGDDAYHRTTRAAMDLMFERCWDYVARGMTKEFVTGNNDADGVYFLFWVRERFPEMAEHLRSKLALWGGNASGVNVANIDNLGNVHPDTFWWHYSLGNVRDRPFSEIWQDTSDPIMAGLKAKPRRITGRCGACRYFDICGGNTRVRAMQLTGDAFAEDPACYLSDREDRRDAGAATCRDALPEAAPCAPWLGNGLLAAALLAAARAQAETPATRRWRLYGEHCASCHGAARLGGMGPALLPENLGRLKREDAAEVIASGRAATQMPAFGERLNAAADRGAGRADLHAAGRDAAWGASEIAASREVLVEPTALAEAPRHDADPLNLFVVVESGDHHVTILDGDRFAPITRFASRFALHGGPKFSPDGRFVYFASRDGWISKYDLWGLELIAEVRAGINTRNLAISHDGRVVAVANYLPHTLVLLDARGSCAARGHPGRGCARQDQLARQRGVPGGAAAELRRRAQGHPGDVGGVLRRGRAAGERPGAQSRGGAWSRRLRSTSASRSGAIELKQPLDDFFFGPDYRY